MCWFEARGQFCFNRLALMMEGEVICSPPDVEALCWQTKCDILYFELDSPCCGSLTVLCHHHIQDLRRRRLFACLSRLRHILSLCLSLTEQHIRVWCISPHRLILVFCLMLLRVPIAKASDMDFGQLFERAFNTVHTAPLEALQMIEPHLEASRSLDPEAHSQLLYAASAANLSLGDYGACESYIEQALRFAQQQQRQDWRLNPLVVKAVLSSRFGDKEAAMTLYLEALALAEQYQIYQRQVDVLSNIAIIHGEQGRHERAMEEQLRAIEIAKQHALDYRWIYGNLGSSYQALGRYGEAEQLYQSLLEFARGKVPEDENQVAFSSSNLASLMIQKQLFDQALSYNHQALQVFEKQGNLHYTSESKLQRAAIYRQQQRIEEAKAIAQTVLQSNIAAGDKELVADAYQELYEGALASGDYQQALLHYQDYIEQKEQMLDEASRRQINQLASRLELKQQQQAYSALQQASEVRALKARQRQILLLFTLLVCVLVAVWLLLSYRLVRRQKSQIEAVSEGRRQALVQLEQAQNKLIEAEKMAALGELVVGVAHELNTPLGVCITANSVLQEQQQKILTMLNDKKLSNSALRGFLDNVAESTRVMTSKLDRSAKLVADFKKLSVHRAEHERQVFALREQVERLWDKIQLTLDDDSAGHIEFVFNAPQNPILFSYMQDYDTVFEQLLHNAMEHGLKHQAAGKIWIDIDEDEQHLIIEVKNNGTPIPTELKPRIFLPFVTSGRGAGATGLGLTLVYNTITYQLNGAIELLNGSGITCFRLLLPITELQSPLAGSTVS